MAKKERLYKTIVSETITEKNKFKIIKELLLTLASLLKVNFKGEIKLNITHSIEKEKED